METKQGIKLLVLPILIVLSISFASALGANLLANVSQNFNTAENLATLNVQRYNATWVDLNGTDSHIEVPVSYINWSEKWTINFWYKNNGNNTGNCLFTLSNNSNINFISLCYHGATLKLTNINKSGVTKDSSIVINPTDTDWHLISVKNDLTRLYIVNDTGDWSIGGLKDIAVEFDAFTNLTFGMGAFTVGGNFTNASYGKIQLFNYSLQRQPVNEQYAREKFGNDKGYGIPFIYYHNVGDGANNISVANFTLHLSLLNKTGYKAITAVNYTNWKNDGEIIHRKTVMIGFDDGQIYIINYSFPIMQQYGYVGTVNVITNNIGTAGYMSWENLTTLRNAGWDIGSHTASHSVMTSLTDAQMIAQLNDSRRAIIGNLSYTPIYFVPPNNAHNITTDTYCYDYYTICAGSDVYTTYGWNYYDTPLLNSTGGTGIVRMGVGADTITEDLFSRHVVVYQNEELYLGFRENSGTRVYDTSGYGRNQTLYGTATWETDGKLVNLIDTIDYTADFNTGVWQLINSNLDKSYAVLTWGVQTGSGCSVYYQTGATLIMIMSSLAIIVFSIWFLLKDGWENIDLAKIIIMFIGIVTAVILWQQVGQNLGAACGVVG